MTTTMTAPVHNRYYCKYDYKYNVRSRWQTLLIDDYLLGLMWCLGTLAKDRPFFCFHTYEEDKKYYLRKLQNINEAPILKEMRKARGEMKEYEILRFSDGVYADKLRDLGYDDPEVQFPEVFSAEFVCAVLECNLGVFNTHDVKKINYFSVSSVKHIDQWDKLVGKYLKRSKEPVVHHRNRGTFKLLYTRAEVKYCANIMLTLECANKDFWKNILAEIEKSDKMAAIEEEEKERKKREKEEREAKKIRRKRKVEDQ